MITNFTPASYEEITEYHIVFDDGHFNGSCFPCDSTGNMFKDLCPEAYVNYNNCLKHPERYIRFNKVIESKRTVKNDAFGTCHCGERVELFNMYQGACQCSKCGQWYNLFGQELLPPDEWEEEPEDDYYFSDGMHW